MPANQVLSRLATLSLISSFCITYSLTTPLNCSSERVNLPTVRVYDAAPEDTTIPNNGTVNLTTDIVGEKNTIGWIGLECSHTKAIRWVFNLDFVEPGLRDTYSTTERKVTDFYNASTYHFVAEFNLQITDDPNLEFVFVCATFDDPCERKFAHAFYDAKEKHYILRSLPKSEENLTLVTELEDKIIENTNFGQKYANDSSCNVKFSFRDETQSYFHLFTPKLESISPRTISDRQTLESSFLFSRHLSHACVDYHCDARCYITKKDSTAMHSPLVFFMTNSYNVSRVVHTYHTLISRQGNAVNTPGVTKFAWEYSNPQDLLVMDELPEKVYDGQVLHIKCTLSPFMFSYGAKIGYSFSDSISNSVTFIEEKESDVEATMRTVIGNMTVPKVEKSRKVTLFCFAPIWNSTTGWVNISREFTVSESKVEVSGEGRKYYMLPLNGNFRTSCTANGASTPSLDVSVPANVTTGVKMSKQTTNTTTKVNIVIDRVDETHVGIYKCIAKISESLSIYEFEIKILKNSGKEMSTLTIVLISVLVFISALFLAVVIILYTRFRMEKEEFRKLTEEAVREFFDGVDTRRGTPDETEHTYANSGVKILPYDKKFEVPHRHWSFTGTMLGSGAFGVVHKGVVEMGSRKSTVAIKTVKSTEDIDDFRATLLELKIMSNIGSHRHIVKLVAASTDEIHNRKVFIGVEFCANGSLLSYLQKRKRLFTNMVKDGQIQFQSSMYNNTKNDLPHPEEIVRQESEEIMYSNLVVTSDTSTIDLFKWSFQIASGMNFLESKKVLHADLSARNILLSEDLTVKISDFGLSRELFENSEYMKKSQVVLPFKWMAPESLKYLKFSIKSDVWSYGVTLYEVFTLGEEPYPGQTWNEEFVSMLENGMRLNRPQFCTDNVYTKVMMLCWQAEPSDRIRFADAMAFFEKAIALLTSTRQNSDECRDVC